MDAFIAIYFNADIINRFAINRLTGDNIKQH